MLRTITLASLLVLASALAFAETWTGKLLDTNCSCTPTASTTTFALQVSDKTLKLDDAGNKQAAEAMKQSNTNANRSAEPNAPEAQVTAQVEGTLSGNEIKVSSIKIQ